MSSCFIVAMVSIAIARESWWEGNSLLPAVGTGFALSVLVAIPQFLVVRTLWLPLVPSSEDCSKDGDNAG